MKDWNQNFKYYDIFVSNVANKFLKKEPSTRKGYRFGTISDIIKILGDTVVAGGFIQTIFVKNVLGKQREAGNL